MTALLLLGFIGLLALFLALVSFVEVHRSEPVRPKNVPDNATWVGGQDGGSWVFCEKLVLANQELFECDAYSEDGKHKLADGIYKAYKARWDDVRQVVEYEPLNRPLDEPLKFNAFDGEAFIMSDGITLKIEDR